MISKVKEKVPGEKRKGDISHEKIDSAKYNPIVVVEGAIDLFNHITATSSRPVEERRRVMRIDF